MMIGFFYPEDIAGIIQIQRWINQRSNREYEESKKKSEGQGQGGQSESNSNLPPVHDLWEKGSSFNPAMFQRIG